MEPSELVVVTSMVVGIIVELCWEVRLEEASDVWEEASEVWVESADVVGVDWALDGLSVEEGLSVDDGVVDASEELSVEDGSEVLSVEDGSDVDCRVDVGVVVVASVVDESSDVVVGAAVELSSVLDGAAVVVLGEG